MKSLSFPIFMLETETGHISLICDAQSLKIIIEEFIDILRVDFKFWNLDGYELTFGEDYLKNDTFGMSEHSNHQEVKRILLAFLEKKGLKPEKQNNKSLLDIFRSADGK